MKKMIDDGAVSSAEWVDDQTDKSIEPSEHYLGMHDDQYGYQCAKMLNGSATCFPAAFKMHKDKADEAGHEDVSAGAQELMDYMSAAKKSKKPSKKTLHGTIIRDPKFLATLNGLCKDKSNTINGFWCLASVEKIDEDGDLVMIDGITADLDAENGRYIPLLPSHQRKLPDAKAAEIGRVEQLVKTSVDGVPALAAYFTFALDENGTPIDDLVKSYYTRYKLGYSNTFSIGADVTDAEPLPTGGYKFLQTKLYELSAVSIPANSDAVGLTRGLEEDVLIKKIDTLELMIKNLGSMMETYNTSISERNDSLEAALVSLKAKKEPVTAAPKNDNLASELSKMLDKYNK